MKVLLCIDSLNSSEAVIEEVLARSWPAGTRFCVIHVVDSRYTGTRFFVGAGCGAFVPGFSCPGVAPANVAIDSEIDNQREKTKCDLKPSCKSGRIEHRFEIVFDKAATVAVCAAFLAKPVFKRR